MIDEKIIKIGDTYIGDNNPPFIIAEMSANHGGSLEEAHNIIDAIANAGAHAVKLQTYTADTMTLDISGNDFLLNEGPWAGRTLHDLYKLAHTPWEWHEELFRHANDIGLSIFSSPFDKSAVDFLEKLDVPVYKIASFEMVDIPLIEYTAGKGKPLIISTGMATDIEIFEAVNAAKGAGCKDICLLQCTSGYPAPVEDMDLLSLQRLRVCYDTLVGLSDHTLEVAVPVVAIALGACMIEKHVIGNRANGGPDANFSLEPHELKQLVHNSKIAWQALGTAKRRIKESERTQLSLRRSIYIVEDMQKGDILTNNNMKCIRPGYGLPPKYYSMFLGKRINKNINKGTRVSWDIIA